MCRLKLTSHQLAQKISITKNEQVKPSLKAKYCPRVSCKQKNAQKPCDFDRWRMTLKFKRVLEIVEAHVSAKYHQAGCSGA